LTAWCRALACSTQQPPSRALCLPPTTPQLVHGLAPGEAAGAPLRAATAAAAGRVGAGAGAAGGAATAAAAAPAAVARSRRSTCGGGMLGAGSCSNLLGFVQDCARWGWLLGSVPHKQMQGSGWGLWADSA